MASYLKSQAAAYVLLPLAALSWSGSHVIARAIAGHVPPAGLAVFRWMLVLAIVLLIARPQIRKDWPKLRQKAGIMAFLALTGGGAFGTLQFVALQYTTAINMGVVGSVAPAFIVAASFLLFGDRLGLSQLAGVAISLVGVLAIVTRLHPESLLALDFNGGDLIILANMMLWAIYCACLRLRPDVHLMSFLFMMAGYSLVGNLPFAIYEHMIGYRLVADLTTASAILYTATFTSFLAYFAWNRGVDLVGAPRAGAFLHTIPLFGSTLAMIFLGEQLMVYHIVGFVLILSGVTLAARPTAAAQAAGTASDTRG